MSTQDQSTEVDRSLATTILADIQDYLSLKLTLAGVMLILIGYGINEGAWAGVFAAWGISTIAVFLPIFVYLRWRQS